MEAMSSETADSNSFLEYGSNISHLPDDYCICRSLKAITLSDPRSAIDQSYSEIS